MLKAFDHLNIRCSDLQRSRDFYVTVLGLMDGARPPFATKGCWLYLDGRPVVHLVEDLDAASHGMGAGRLHHIAFEGVDLEATRRALIAAGVAFREAAAPLDRPAQLFVHDPDGIQYELSFPT